MTEKIHLVCAECGVSVTADWGGDESAGWLTDRVFFDGEQELEDSEWAMCPKCKDARGGAQSVLMQEADASPNPACISCGRFAPDWDTDDGHAEADTWACAERDSEGEFSPLFSLAASRELCQRGFSAHDMNRVFPQILGLLCPECQPCPPHFTPSQLSARFFRESPSVSPNRSQRNEKNRRKQEKIRRRQGRKAR